MNSELSLTEKKKKKKNEVDLIIDSKLSNWRRMWSWFDDAQSFRLKKRCWSDHELRIIIDEKEEEEKKRWNSWSIKLSIENSSNVEALVWNVFIQYIKFVVAVSSYSLLNTSIENQTSKSISFYSWKRQFSIDKNIKLARALLTRVMIIFRDLLAQLLVWFNNKRRWCNSEKEN